MQTFSKRSERLSASLGEEKETTSNTNKKRETAVSQRLTNFVLQMYHQSIYNIIHNDTTGELARHTRHKMKYRHHPRGEHIPIKDRLSIHERSKEADGKRFGDFEMDLIVERTQIN